MILMYRKLGKILYKNETVSGLWPVLLHNQSFIETTTPHYNIGLD